MRRTVATVAQKGVLRMDEWRWWTAAKLGRAIGAGEIDPVDLCEVYLAAIKAHEFGDRIYARLTEDRSRAEAQAASDRAKAGLRRGPLDGVPISWKDLFDTAGVATEAGTALMAGRVPDRDAEVLQNATAAGLVCLGKVHMSEIAFSGLGLNPKTATSPCVNDHGAVAGGSSSGSAASVAFGLAAASIGSDTGGSVRIPSAWNDLVGLKTTHGRVSLNGVVPLCETFDTVGPLCRSVEDAVLVLAALEGGKAPDLTGGTLEGVRLAVLQTVAMQDVRAEPLAAFEGACARLKAAGAVLEPLEFAPMEEAFAFAGPLFTADAYSWWKERIEAAPDKMFPQILERIRPGADVNAVEFLRAWRRLHEIRAEWRAAVAGYDAVIMPSAPILPPNADKLLTDNDYYVTENLLALRNTRVGNLMGECSVTLPVGVPSCGLLLNMGPDEDARLVRLAGVVERVLG